MKTGGLEKSNLSYLRVELHHNMEEVMKGIRLSKDPKAQETLQYQYK